MYHPRQKMRCSSPSAVVLPELSVNEEGYAYYKQVNQATKTLPEVETTDLRALLDAGVSIKQVSTKIFASDKIVTDMSPEPQNKEGVNNDEE